MGKRPDLALRNKSPEHIAKVRLARVGFCHTPESKAKMSQSQRGNKNHFSHAQSDITKKRISEIKLLTAPRGDKHPMWRGGFPKCIECGKQLSSYGAERCQLHANRKIISERIYSPSEETKDRLRKAAIRQLMSGTQKQDTSIEIKMRDALDGEGIPHEHPFPFAGKFLCDFGIPEKKIVIECDGDYWHNREDIKKRDASKNGYIKKCGWTMLRFWEHEINGNVGACLDKVRLTFANP
jgi:very-short-patch-repair endonuclease